MDAPDAGEETSADGGIAMASYYAVTFDTQGGEPVPELQMVEEGGCAQRPEDPTRDRSAFTGWFLDGEDYFANPTPINSDVTLTAGWEVEQLEQEVGEKPDEEPGQQFEDEIEIVDQPEASITEGGNTTNYVTFAEAAEAADDSKTITLLRNIEDSYTMQKGETLIVEKAGFEIEVKAPNGYTLKETVASGVTTYTLTANTYTVAFDKNGGTGTMDSQSFTYDEAKALTANVFTRTGYAFNGWNTKSYVSKSLSVHSMTGDTYGRRTNAKKVEVTKTAYTMDVGRVDMIHANVVGVNPNKLAVDHGGLLRYVTDDSRVAIVNRSGRITAVGKGRCNIYVLASNGVYAKVRVVVE